MFYSDRANVNNQYLTNVFCVAKTHGLNLPVYQINFCNKNKYKGLGDIKCDAFVLMICGNENHESVEHYLSDSRVKMIVKNYPRMLNITDGNETGQTYGTFLDQNGREKFIVEKESDNIITIPLGYCNDFNPVPTFNHREPGGFIGQWTQFRNDKIKAIDKAFDDSPYDWVFYRGFGPFVQSDVDSDNKKFSYSLKPKIYSNFMSRIESAFVFSGQSPETYRLFEAAMAGCIIVHDILPDTWYYNDLPYVPCNFDNFKSVYDYIETHKHDLKSLTGIWWQNFASPAAVGNKIAQFAKSVGV